MKTRNIILLALTALLTVSCHSWDDPAENAGNESYGNKYLQESNVVNLADLKAKYKNEISNATPKKIDKATQIKVIVTGNDEGSNIYKTLYVADATGGISLSIDKSSIFSEACVGQCMLIELEGLYIGGYGQQPQIGTKYIKEEGADPQIGRMSRNTWADHFKLIPPIEGLSVKPITTNDISALDIDKDFGKVVTLVGITMRDADGKAVFAPSDGSVKLSGGCANREIANQAATVYVRTSTYAKYASMVMPTEKFNITGVVSRFANDWQIMPRTLNDIATYTGTETLDYHVDYVPVSPAGDGSAKDPFNVSGAIEECVKIGEEVSTKKYYVQGYVTADAEVDTKFGNITFNIADTKLGGKNFICYQMAGSDGKGLPNNFKVSKGDEVIIYGPMYNYGGNKPETAGKGAAIIFSVNGKKTDGTDAGLPSDVPEAIPEGDGLTPETAFNAAAANLEAAKLESKATSEKQYYIKGKVAKFPKDGNYGEGNYPKTANFYISADGQDANTFYIYAAKYLGNADYSSGDVLKVGDDVVILGNLTNYNGTLETAQGKTYLYSLNGKTN